MYDLYSSISSDMSFLSMATIIGNRSESDRPGSVRICIYGITSLVVVLQLFTTRHGQTAAKNRTTVATRYDITYDRTTAPWRSGWSRARVEHCYHRGRRQRRDYDSRSATDLSSARGWPTCQMRSVYPDDPPADRRSRVLCDNVYKTSQQ